MSDQRSPHMTIEPPEVIAMILSDGCEDHHGLYEIIWALNRRYPGVAEEAKRAAAQQALSDLVKRGLVALYTTVWPGGTFAAVPEGQVASAISAASSWASPPASPVTYYCFAATAAGEQAYHSGKVERT